MPRLSTLMCAVAGSILFYIRGYDHRGIVSKGLVEHSVWFFIFRLGEKRRESPMKNILLFSTLLCAIALPALGELTAADLDKIRLIVKDEIKKEVTSASVTEKLNNSHKKSRT